MLETMKEIGFFGLKIKNRFLYFFDLKRASPIKTLRIIL